MSRTTIAWATDTWNPLRARRKDNGKVGSACVRVSDACTHCYAATFNKRELPNHGTGLDYTVGNMAKVETFLDEKMLLAPLKWKKPRRIFVGSMTDVWGEWVPFEMIDKIMAIAALCPQHTWLFLTKRAKRMREYWTSSIGVRVRMDKILLEAVGITGTKYEIMDFLRLAYSPLSNVHLGVTAEDQQRADERIPDLLATPAAVRFVSIEPMLGPIRFAEVPGFNKAGQAGQDLVSNFWCIAGGESGHGARPSHPDWFRSIRDQCQTAKVPFFFKQWGNWTSGENVGHLRKVPTATFDGEDWEYGASDDWITEADNGPIMYSVGKKAAGRFLDGVEHSEFPEVRP